MTIRGEVFLFEMENTMAQICNTAKQKSVARLCSVIVTTVAFQVLLNYKMEVFFSQISCIKYSMLIYFSYLLYLSGVPN